MSLRFKNLPCINLKKMYFNLRCHFCSAVQNILLFFAHLFTFPDSRAATKIINHRFSCWCLQLENNLSSGCHLKSVLKRLILLFCPPLFLSSASSRVELEQAPFFEPSPLFRAQAELKLWVSIPIEPEPVKITLEPASSPRFSRFELESPSSSLHWAFFL